MNQKKTFENGDVILVASISKEESRRVQRERMNRTERQAEDLLKMIETLKKDRKHSAIQP